MSIRIEIEKNLEKNFRKAAMQTYGYEKGSLKKAAEKAFELWIVMERTDSIPDVEEPVKLIEGMLSFLKGKYTSVQLQHEMKKLWTKK